MVKLAALITSLWIIATSSAIGATATYVEPALLSAAEETAVSTSGDDSGVFLGLSETLALHFDTPFGTTAGESVTIFTLLPDSGAARFQVSFGSYNSGSPILAHSRTAWAGGSLNVNNLFGKGCALLGGCDYIELTTTRTRRGASGVEVDYILVDGEIVEVTSPTPEPSTWALLIIGFIATATRLKSLRRNGAILNTENTPTSRPAT